MQKCADMAVRSKSNRKHPVRRATHAQFGLTSAPTETQGLSVLGAAVHAWDGTSSLCAPELQRAPTLPTP
jgi:hypothetical protein